MVCPLQSGHRMKITPYLQMKRDKRWKNKHSERAEVSSKTDYKRQSICLPHHNTTGESSALVIWLLLMAPQGWSYSRKMLNTASLWPYSHKHLINNTISIHIHYWAFNNSTDYKRCEAVRKQKKTDEKPLGMWCVCRVQNELFASAARTALTMENDTP